MDYQNRKNSDTRRSFIKLTRWTTVLDCVPCDGPLMSWTSLTPDWRVIIQQSCLATEKTAVTWTGRQTVGPRWPLICGYLLDFRPARPRFPLADVIIIGIGMTDGCLWHNRAESVAAGGGTEASDRGFVCSWLGRAEHSCSALSWRK